MNKKTASAAEVLTAALQENGRAVVFGEQTFGKGIVQTIQPVRGDAGISVTIARYMTPLGNNINKKGITPNANIPCDPIGDIAACLEAPAVMAKL